MDSRTLILALALGNLVLGVLLAAAFSGAKRTPLLSVWLSARHFQTLAWGLFLLRGGIPDLFSITAANALLIVGIAFEAGALWEFAGWPGWRRFGSVVLTVFVAGFCLLWFSDAGAPLTGAVASLLAGVLYAAAALALLLDWKSGTPLRRTAGLISLLLALALAVSGVLAMLFSGGSLFFGAAALQISGLAGLFLLAMLFGFGFLLLLKEQSDQALFRLSVMDPLTGAPNRRGFFNALNPWMALARRPGHESAVIMFDLDHFKRINDSYGHPVGDVVLKSVVEAGQQQLRESDLIGRLGGEEFAVLLPKTSLADAVMVAERMRQAIAALPVKTERAVIYITASMGVTTIRADDNTVTLFKRADEALYQAKKLGRNRVVEAAAAEILA